MGCSTSKGGDVKDAADSQAAPEAKLMGHDRITEYGGTDNPCIVAGVEGGIKGAFKGAILALVSEPAKEPLLNNEAPQEEIVSTAGKKKKGSRWGPAEPAPEPPPVDGPDGAPNDLAANAETDQTTAEVPAEDRGAEGDPEHIAAEPIVDVVDEEMSAAVAEDVVQQDSPAEDNIAVDPSVVVAAQSAKVVDGTDKEKGDGTKKKKKSKKPAADEKSNKPAADAEPAAVSNLPAEVVVLVEEASDSGSAKKTKSSGKEDANGTADAAAVGDKTQWKIKVKKAGAAPKNMPRIGTASPPPEKSETLPDGQKTLAERIEESAAEQTPKSEPDVPKKKKKNDDAPAAADASLVAESTCVVTEVAEEDGKKKKKQKKPAAETAAETILDSTESIAAEEEVAESSAVDGVETCIVADKAPEEDDSKTKTESKLLKKMKKTCKDKAVDVAAEGGASKSDQDGKETEETRNLWDELSPAAAGASIVGASADVSATMTMTKIDLDVEQAVVVKAKLDETIPATSEFSADHLTANASQEVSSAGAKARPSDEHPCKDIAAKATQVAADKRRSTPSTEVPQSDLNGDSNSMEPDKAEADNSVADRRCMCF